MLSVPPNFRTCPSPQVPGLQHTADEVAALKLHIRELEGELSDLRSARQQVEVAEAARDKAVAEANRSLTMLSNLEARLQQVEDDNETLGSSLDQERRRRSATGAAAGGMAGGHGGWGGGTVSEPPLGDLAALPRDKWPSAVRRLVEGIERAAGAAAAAEGGAVEVAAPTGGDGEKVERLEGQVLAEQLRGEQLQRRLVELEGQLEEAQAQGRAAEDGSRAALQAARETWDRHQVRLCAGSGGGGRVLQAAGRRGTGSRQVLSD